MKTKRISISATLRNIQTTLGCNKQKAAEIAKSIINLKVEFDLNLSLAQLWEQEKTYFLNYGCTSFEAGYTRKLRTI